MDKDTVQKLRDTITKSKNIGIAVGKNPSVDEMAAALSLYLVFRSANKPVSIASPTDPIVELSSLVGINRVQKSLGGDAGDLVVSFPYQEGEIDKVSYTLEEGFLNIIVKASEQGLSFDEKDIKYTRGSGAVDTLFVVGTPRLSDLGDVVDTQKLRDITVINVDNKQANEKFGDIVLVSPRFSSVSEQIADFALTLGLRVDQDAAQNLMVGVTVATNNFQDPRTSPLAFEVVSFLMKRGARRLKPQVEERDEYIESLSRDVRDEAPAPSRDMDRRDRDQSGEARTKQREDDRSQERPQNGFQDRSQTPRRDQQAQNFSRDEDTRQAEAQRQPQKPTQDDNQPVDDDEEAPLDWLTPKVYKGSSDVE